MQQLELIPTLLVDTDIEFLAQINAIDALVNMVHIDVLDNTLIEGETWADPELIGEELTLDCELHLMVKNPLAVVRDWMSEDVQQLKRVLLHYEASHDATRDVVNQIQSYGLEVGVVLNPQTPSSVLDGWVEELDMVQIMSVKPGKQGGEFIRESLDTVRVLRETYPDLPIAIDGHMNSDTIPEAIAAGATRICVGSAITQSDDIAAATQELKTLIHGLTK